jgi:hypothetical protein
MKGNSPLRVDKSKIVKGNILTNFSRTSKPILVKRKSNLPWMKGIQVSLNIGPGPLQSGYNHKNVNIGPEMIKSTSRLYDVKLNYMYVC